MMIYDDDGVLAPIFSMSIGIPFNTCFEYRQKAFYMELCYTTAFAKKTLAAGSGG